MTITAFLNRLSLISLSLMLAFFMTPSLVHAGEVGNDEKGGESTKSEFVLFESYASSNDSSASKSPSESIDTGKNLYSESYSNGQNDVVESTGFALKGTQDQQVTNGAERVDGGSDDHPSSWRFNAGNHVYSYEGR